MTSMEILDPSFDQRRWRPARRRRLLLATYLDFLIFSIPWAYFVAITDRFVPGFAIQPWYVRYLVFAIVELIVLQRASLSPGANLLGIRFVDAKSGRTGVDRLWSNRIPFVDIHLQRAESWFSLSAGTFLLLDATKTLVRWTMYSPPLPLFGIQTEGLGGALTNIGIGAGEVYAACLVLRVHRRALSFGIPFYAFLALSAAVSWDLWDAWAERYVIARRAYEGRAVRPGEIESLQSMAPELPIVAMVFNASLIMMLTRRLLPLEDGTGRGAPG
jgi:hypothetical protein